MFAAFIYGLIAGMGIMFLFWQLVRVEGFGNYSSLVAPAKNTDVTCPLIFGSIECGATGSTQRVQGSKEAFG